MPKNQSVTVPEITRSIKPAREAVRKIANSMISIAPSQIIFAITFLLMTMNSRAKGSASTTANARSFGFE